MIHHAHALNNFNTQFVIKILKILNASQNTAFDCEIRLVTSSNINI
jgi:hypothetical protein